MYWFSPGTSHISQKWCVANWKLEVNVVFFFSLLLSTLLDTKSNMRLTTPQLHQQQQTVLEWD